LREIAEIRLTSKLPSSSSSSGSSGTTSGAASNVVVYNVMIDVDNPALKLRPGMTANVNFTVASTDNVPKVANAALRYRPSDKNPEEIQKLLARFQASIGDTRRPHRRRRAFGTPRVRPAPNPVAGDSSTSPVEELARG
jgi:hypothetical protein